VVDAEEKQESLGWKGSIEYKNASLHFSLRDKNKQAILPDKAIATVTRPTQSGMDFTLELTGKSTPITFPARGLWLVRVDVSHAGVHYQQSKRIVVP